jgi:hypothetical protein
MGLRTLPWGTPELMGNKGETFPFTLIRNCWLLRYDFNSANNDGRCSLLLYNNPGCQTLSKAWLTSKNTNVQYSLLFKALRIVWVVWWHCWLWSGLDEIQTGVLLMVISVLMNYFTWYLYRSNNVLAMWLCWEWLCILECLSVSSCVLCYIIWQCVDRFKARKKEGG